MGVDLTLPRGTPSRRNLCADLPLSGGGCEGMHRHRRGAGRVRLLSKNMTPIVKRGVARQEAQTYGSAILAARGGRLLARQQALK